MKCKWLIIKIVIIDPFISVSFIGVFFRLKLLPIKKPIKKLIFTGFNSCKNMKLLYFFFQTLPSKAASTSAFVM
jgi:hypothetical protein